MKMKMKILFAEIKDKLDPIFCLFSHLFQNLRKQENEENLQHNHKFLSALPPLRMQQL